MSSVGPLDFQPSTTHELIIGVITSFGAELPCPNLDVLGSDDDFIQSAFDNCLEIITSSIDPSPTPLEAIILSPNPFSKTNHTKLTISNLHQKATIRIFDINGKLVENIWLENNTSINWTPNFSLSNGVYFVEVKDQNARKV